MSEKTNNTKKQKTTSPAVKAVLVIVIILCIGVIGFSAYKLISTKLEYKKSRDEYDKLREYTTEKNTDTAATGRVITVTASDDSTPVDFEVVDAPGTSCPVEVDCKSLAEKNPDFAGWLYVEAVDISYPMVQGPDDDYYLHRTFEGTYNFSGSIFLESLCRKDFTTPVTIVYGHNMKDRSMFGSLKYLINEGMYTNSSYFWIVTEEHEYRYRFISLEHTDAYSDVYTVFNYPCEEAVSYMRDRVSHSHVSFNVPVLDLNSRIVVLSTCVGADSPERFVVTGILDMIDGEEIYDENGNFIERAED